MNIDGRLHVVPFLFLLHYDVILCMVVTASVLDIGQHRPWSTRQYAVAIAGHYFRTINYVFSVWKKRTTTNSLW